MAVTVTVDLPPDVEQKVRAENPDLPAAVREAYLLHLFRQGVLTHYDLSQALGLDRFETDAFLQKHRVYEQGITEEEVEADVRSLRELLGRNGS
jgi:hypothetical protein